MYIFVSPEIKNFLLTNISVNFYIDPLLLLQ